MRSVLHIGALDVLFQPGFQEVQQFHRHGYPAAVKVLLKLYDAPGQRIVLRLMRREIRIVVQAHEPFLVREMCGGIPYQPVEDPPERGFSLSGGHGAV